MFRKPLAALVFAAALALPGAAQQSAVPTDEMIGPMVEPHGQSLRTTNSCGGGRPARRASSRTMKEVTPLDAYRWLELDLITTPSFIRGPCPFSCLAA